MDLVVEATNLQKSYRANQAVKDVSLNLAEGECLALLGPNGAGKTTTVEMLEGLVTPDSGLIKIFGLPLRGNEEQISQRVGVLLQNSQLYKKLTVRETFALFASFYRSSQPVEDVIAQMGLEEKADSRLEHLSGGQKQRVYIGCAIINKPRLVFLDEPTTGLDPQARRMIWDLVANLKSHGCSIFLTTHYMEEAETLADQVAVIDHGLVIAEGSPEALIKSTCGPQLLFIQADGVDLDSWWGQLQSKVGSLQHARPADNGLLLPAENPIDAIIAVSKAAESLGLVLRRLELRRSSLEDVFLNLTGRHIRDE